MSPSLLEADYSTTEQRLLAHYCMRDVETFGAAVGFTYNTGRIPRSPEMQNLTYRWRRNGMLIEEIEREKRALKRAQELQKQYNQQRNRSLAVARAKPWLASMALPSRVYTTGGAGVIRQSTLHPTKGWQTVRTEVVK